MHFLNGFLSGDQARYVLAWMRYRAGTRTTAPSLTYWRVTRDEAATLRVYADMLCERLGERPA